MNNDTEQSTTTMAHLIQTIRTNDFDTFKKLIEQSPERLRWAQTDFGLMLLREFIRENRREMFEYMLTFQDLEIRKRALRHMLDFNSNEHEYFVHELIKGSELIHEEYKHQTLLHWSIGKSWLNLAKFLLEAGVDANVKDHFDYTPLLKVLLTSPREDDSEFISMLLYYGVDALIETFDGYHAFELAVTKKRSFLIQETLFYYTYDQCTHVEIFSNVLLELAKEKSPLFYEILQHDIEVVVSPSSEEFLSTFQNLLTIDVDVLQILLEKQYSMVCHIFDKCNNEILNRSECPPDVNYFYQIWQRGIYTALIPPNVLVNLNHLCESGDELRLHIQHFCVNLESSRVFSLLVRADAPELLFYMLTHGLRVDRMALDSVFDRYGYGQLFRLLLQLDHEKNERQYYSKKTKNAIVALICDSNLDLKDFFQNLDDYSENSVKQLLYYYAHPDLAAFFLNSSSIQVENHPRVPRLLELSRNIFRKYLVTAFNIEWTKQFYNVVNFLPISSTYKKIIALESKLY